MSENGRRRATAYLIATVAPLATGAARYALWDVLGGTAQAIPFVIPVVLAAWYGGLRPGLAATGLSALLVVVLFLPPAFSLRVDSAAELMSLLLFLVVAVIVTWLCESLHRARRRAEMETQRTTTVLESISDGFYTLSPDWRFTYINGAAERYFGRPREGLLGRVLWEVFPAKRDSEFHRCYHRAVDESIPVSFEAFSPVTRRWVETHAYPSSDGLSVFFKDITPRKEADAALRSERERVQFVADAVPALISYIDVDCRYRLNNRAYEAWFGRPKSEVVGRHMREVLGEAAWDRIRPHVERALTGHVVSYETEAPYRDGGTRWISASYTPDIDEHGVVQGVVAHVNDITVQKHAEAQLRRRVDEIEKLMEFMPIAVMKADDAECRHVTGNPAAHRLLHVPADRNLSRTAPETAGPGGYRAFRDGQEVPPDQLPMQYACRHGVEVRDAELEIVHAGGQTNHIYSYATPLFAESGEVRGCLFAALDITERKRAEVALQRAEERFRASQDASLYGFTILRCVRDDNGRIVDFEWEYANPAAATLLKRPAEALVGRRLLSVLPSNERSSDLFERYVRVVETGVPHDYELRYQADGIDGWFRNMAVRLGDGVAVSFTDVTARRLAEQQREQSLSLFNSLVSAAPVGIALLDSEMRYRLVNGPLARMNGLPAADHIGRSVADIVPMVYAQAEPIFRQVVESREAMIDVILEGEWPDSPGTSGTWRQSWFPVPDQDGHTWSVGVIVEDITAQRLAQEQQRRAEKRIGDLVAVLKEADRRKDEFLATLAHELRNPLAPIRNALQLLRLAPGSSVTLEQARSMMERQIGQMVHLIDDLLDVSRITSGKVHLRMTRLALAPTIQSALEATRPLVDDSGHHLSVTLPSEPMWLDADPTRLVQVFSNLLSNAAKYTPHGGHISVEVGREGDQAVVAVRDTGIGIASEHLPHLFEMFTQFAPSVDRSHGGLGIGLSLVNGLVQMHGGSIDARSEGPGTGSEFIVRLPLVEHQPDAAPPAAPRREARSPLRVLVVDDNVDSSESLAMLLEFDGHEVRTASDGIEAVEIAESFRPRVILLDIGMPRMNGYQAAQHIRAQEWGRHIVLVAMTGWGQDEDKRRALDAGFDHHLTKPVDPGALDRVLAVSDVPG